MKKIAPSHIERPLDGMRWVKRLAVLFILSFPFVEEPSSRADGYSPCPDKDYFEVVVRPGDTLSKLCRKHYGPDGRHCLDEVMRLNPHLADPNLIVVGAKLTFPCPRPDKATVAETPPRLLTQPTVSPAGEVEGTVAVYPPGMPGSIDRLVWLNDNTARISGRIAPGSRAAFFVYVPGDLEYEQRDLIVEADGSFTVKAVIGRLGRDYQRSFLLKLAILDGEGTRIGEVRRTVFRTRERAEEMAWGDRAGYGEVEYGPIGREGIDTWLAAQSKDALGVDNSYFRIPGGVIVGNYRYRGYNPDERYLSWYGRITLYGSSCMAKALILDGQIERAEAIIKVWAAQVDQVGKVPRSANVIGDNYISPDLRTGEIAHFLGALAALRLATGRPDWDMLMQRIVMAYVAPLQDGETGLVRGGYNGRGSSGYSRPLGYVDITWCSAEHNFDLYQALVLLAKEFEASTFGGDCGAMAEKIAAGIETYLWDESDGTFHRGWRPESGADRARALDCSSWGALYLLKRARLAELAGKVDAKQHYINQARRALNYAETHFQTRWPYRTPDGKQGVIYGFRPYDGRIDDLRWEDAEGGIIDWDALHAMVWSEGTLGVAKAWEEFARVTGNIEAEQRSRALYKEMLHLQTLSDKGGLLYSTVQIKGHFTMGEELASLAWFAYMDYLRSTTDWRRKDELLAWIPW